MCMVVVQDLHSEETQVGTERFRIPSRPGVNPPSTIPNPNPVDLLIPNPNPIPVNLAMIPNPIPIPVIFPSAIPNPNPIPISSYWYEIIVREFRN